MRLKNILLVVEDIERSKRFYQELFGLKVIRDFGNNIILTEGLVLQEKKDWEELIGKQSDSAPYNMELYFEGSKPEIFLGKIKEYPEKVNVLNELTEYGEGRSVIRILDPDGHIIEIAYE